MAEEKDQNNNKNRNSISTGNPLLDLGFAAVAAVVGATVGEVAHRVSETRSRKKAQKLAMEENNKSTKIHKKENQ